MGYWNRKIQEPRLDDPAYDKLEAENSTIMSRLLRESYESSLVD